MGTFSLRERGWLFKATHAGGLHFVTSDAMLQTLSRFLAHGKDRRYPNHSRYKREKAKSFRHVMNTPMWLLRDNRVCNRPQFLGVADKRFLFRGRRLLVAGHALVLSSTLPYYFLS